MNSENINSAALTQYQWDSDSGTLINPFRVTNNDYFMSLTHSPNSASMDSGFNTDASGNNIASPSIQNFPPNYNDFSNPPQSVHSASNYHNISSTYHQNYSSPVSQQQNNWFFNDAVNQQLPPPASLSARPVYLEIMEQPNDNFRFRYATEQGPHGTIKGPQGTIKGNSIVNDKNEKCFPTVVLHNYNSTSDVVIRCCLYQKIEDDQDCSMQRNIHPHKLIMKPRNLENYDPHYFKISKQNNFTAVFQGLGIIQTKKDEMPEVLTNKLKKEREYEGNRRLNEAEINALSIEVEKLAKKKIEINQIALGFTAFMKDELSNEWIKIGDTVFSDTINNEKSVKGKLMIARMSTCKSFAEGGTEIFMFVNKVDKNTVQVRFFETDDGDTDGVVTWEANGIFSPSDVHHQYGIVLTTPPYKKQNIEEEVKVFIQLYRKNAPNESRSEAHEFVYKPNRVKRKYPRPNNAPIPTVVTSFETSKNSPSNNVFMPSPTNSTHDSGDQVNFGHGSLSTQHQEQEEEEEVDDIVNLILTITSEGYESPSSNISLIESYLNEGCNLEIDAAAPRVAKTFSILEKLKLIKKLFEGKCDNEKVRNMMLMVIDENAFTDLIQDGSMEDILEIALMIAKYKLNDLLQFKNEFDQNALHLCIINGYENILKVFIKLGVRVNQADVFGQTPLHLAAQENSLQSIKALLSAPEISVNEMNDKGCTPLSLSVSNNNLSMTKLLIAAGAIPSLKNPTNGFNCLHVAVNAHQPKLEMIRYLIEVDKSMLFNESKTGKNVRQLAISNKLLPKIIDYISTFYDEELFFDEKCLKELCEIFDRHDNWKVFVTLMDIDDKIGEWELLDSPSQALFSYLKNSLKKSLDDIIGLLDVLNNDVDRMSAMNSIDEMIARKFDK